MNTPNHRTITLGAVLMALLMTVAMLTVFLGFRQAIATEPTDPDYCQYHPEDPICTGEPTIVEETTILDEETTVIEETTGMEETTMPVDEETTIVEDTTVDTPPDTDGPDKPDNPVDKPDRPDKPVDTSVDTPGDDVVVIGTPEGPVGITVTVTETTLICDSPTEGFRVPRVDLDGDEVITNVEDAAMVVAGSTGSEDAVLQNTAATPDQADAAVKAANAPAISELPETGGARLIPLGAGALLLLVAAGLVTRRIVR